MSAVASRVSCAVEDGLCLITLDNPPVNALSVNQGVVQRLMDHLRAGEQDPRVSAFVLLGAGRNFCGGADIAEFGTPYDAGQATAPDLTPFMDTLTKPIVAALHGATMGGGFEIALACHYRVAAPDTRIALPEVRLGILPGAGGTQRVARLLGVRRALDFVLTGDAVDAANAKALGLVDAVADGDVDAAAKAFARRLLAAGGGVRRASALRLRMEEAAEPFFAEQRTRARARWPGCPAPLALVDCIEAAATKPFAEGLAHEARLFARLVTSPEAFAMRHLFFAERAVAKVPTGARTLQRAGVLGAGAGACGIATVLAAAGLTVTLLAEDDAAAAQAARDIDRGLDQAVRKGRIDRDEALAQRARVRCERCLEALADSEIVVVAVANELEHTRRVVVDLERVCGDDTLIALNTGNLDVDQVAEAATRPQHVLGLHFFLPAPVMRLVEVAPGRKADAAVVATALALVRRMDKFGVRVAPRPAFVATRTLQAYLHEAACLLDEGVQPARLDRLMRGFGLPLGPFELADLIGLDVGARLREPGGVPAFAGLRRTVLMDRLLALGRLGRQSGAGVHRYGDDGVARPDEELAAWVRQRGNGDEPTDGELVERLLARLVNEGARVLDEGLARCAADIDVVHAHGYGFPRRLGGPMYHADTLGLARVLEVVQHHHRRHGADWTPSPTLAALAATGRRFNPIDQEQK